jgi:hypothetical protein
MMSHCHRHTRALPRSIVLIALFWSQQALATTTNIREHEASALSTEFEAWTVQNNRQYYGSLAQAEEQNKRFQIWKENDGE